MSRSVSGANDHCVADPTWVQWLYHCSPMWLLVLCVVGLACIMLWCLFQSMRCWKEKVGIVKSIDLTFGGAGNQVMVIDDQQYATWLDYKEWPKIGSKVRHKPYTKGDGRGRTMLCTDILEVLP